MPRLKGFSNRGGGDITLARQLLMCQRLEFALAAIICAPDRLIAFVQITLLLSGVVFAGFEPNFSVRAAAASAFWPARRAIACLI